MPGTRRWVEMVGSVIAAEAVWAMRLVPVLPPLARRVRGTPGTSGHYVPDGWMEELRGPRSCGIGYKPRVPECRVRLVVRTLGLPQLLL
ncbi:MAG: hypothetical protein AAB303_03000 [Chloroflexota bacterium]